MRFCVVPTLFTLFLFGCAPAPDENAHLEGPIDGLTDEQIHTFAIGDDSFDHVYSPEEGLGPRFNQASCNTCHPNDGAGSPNTLFYRFGRWDGDRFDPMHERGGPQLKNHAVPGFNGDTLPQEATVVSGFIAPPVTGLGLLEAVPLDTLLAMADPTDKDGDGITGHIQWIEATPARDAMAERDNSMLPPSNQIQRFETPDGAFYIGRFGRKAVSISILEQVANAAHDDMGLTTPYRPTHSRSPADGGFHAGGAIGDDGSIAAGATVEIQMPTFNALVFYMKTLRPPARRNTNDPSVQLGERIFEDIGCASCHKTTLKTGDSPIAALRHIVFHPYTDLLLHNMSEELDDGYTEGSATSAQWRTPPLWGIGLRRNAQGGSLHLLHDGRATSWDEAVAFHGGEAAAARAQYQSLPDADHHAIQSFLESL